MAQLKGKMVRQLTSATLKELAPAYINYIDREIKLRDIESIIAYVNKQEKIGRKTNSENLSDPLSLASLSISCTGLLALSMYSEEQKAQFFPIDWLSNSARPNANHIMQCMLTQLTNYSLGAITLLEMGLDNPARALCRLIYELSHQILALTFSRDIFKLYIEGHDEKSSTKIWHQLFAHGKLNKHLNSIEEMLGFDAQLRAYMLSMRKENYEYYSQDVHHSFIANTVGSYFPKFDGTSLPLGVFGGENSTIESTVRYLNFSLWYFLLCYFAILDKQHSVLQQDPQNPRDRFWQDACAMYFCIKDSYLSLYTKAS